ncbi:Eukaryotic translation initiation factor 2-alpha kinase 1 [Smittium mucronatum]|uniref:Eukaryotic translation initiation factor 2-alpha kinase 1 n=1 Tax=Smittium mucronatum TaxID=133383 RepID=A0A1R0H8Y8_9FUNG|nr:Eukaryotic translation initiation factor 2-alpha kinase 1 [Smittium mucronatum]
MRWRWRNMGHPGTKSRIQPPGLDTDYFMSSLLQSSLRPPIPGSPCSDFDNQISEENNDSKILALDSFPNASYFSNPGEVVPRRFGSKLFYVLGTPRMLLNPEFLGDFPSSPKRNIPLFPCNNTKKIVKSTHFREHHSSITQLALISLVDILTTALGKDSVFTQAMFFSICDSLLKTGALQRKYLDLPSPLRMNFKSDLYRILLSAATSAQSLSISTQKQLVCSSNSDSGSDSSSNSISSSQKDSQSPNEDSYISNPNLRSPDSSFENFSSVSSIDGFQSTDSFSSNSGDSFAFPALSSDNMFLNTNTSFICEVDCSQSSVRDENDVSYVKIPANSSSPSELLRDGETLLLRRRSSVLEQNSSFSNNIKGVHSPSHRSSHLNSKIEPESSLNSLSSNTDGLSLIAELLKNCNTSRYAEDFYEGKRLGKGGFGEVFEVQNKLDNRLYAVKKIKIKRESTLEKTLREIKVLARLDHPNIVRYYSSWVEMIEYPKSTFRRHSRTPSKLTTDSIQNNDPLSSLRFRNRLPSTAKNFSLEETIPSGKSVAKQGFPLRDIPSLEISSDSSSLSSDIVHFHRSVKGMTPLFKNSKFKPKLQNLDGYNRDSKSYFENENSNNPDFSLKNVESPNSDAPSNDKISPFFSSKKSLYYVPNDDTDDWSDGVVFENQDLLDYDSKINSAKKSNSFPDVKNEENISTGDFLSKSTEKNKIIINKPYSSYPPDSHGTPKNISTDVFLSADVQDFYGKSFTFGQKDIDSFVLNEGLKNQNSSIPKGVSSIAEKHQKSNAHFNRRRSKSINYSISKTAPENKNHLHSIFQDKSVQNYVKSKSIHSLHQNRKNYATLFVQMQLCQSNLREYLLERNARISKNPNLYHFLIYKDVNLAVFRAITSAVKVIHSHNLIHRDLKPANVFLDFDYVLCEHCNTCSQDSNAFNFSIPNSNCQGVQWDHVFKDKSLSNNANDPCNCTRVKLIPRVGDFGLAVSSNSNPSIDNPSLAFHPLKTEPQLPSNNPPTFSQSNSQSQGQTRDSDSFHDSEKKTQHTSGVGTVTYSAPEQISSSTQNYDSKVDIYSLGIIFFELFYPFNTLMERDHVLRDLKKGIFPPSFMEKYPDYVGFINSMMSPNPDLRPTSIEVLGNRILNLSQIIDPKPPRSAENPNSPHISNDLVKVRGKPSISSKCSKEAFIQTHGQEKDHSLSLIFEKKALRSESKLTVRTDSFDIVCGMNSFSSSTGMLSYASGSSMSNTPLEYRKEENGSGKFLENSGISKSGSYTRNNIVDVKPSVVGIEEKSVETDRKELVSRGSNVGMLSLLLNSDADKVRNMPANSATQEKSPSFDQCMGNEGGFKPSSKIIPGRSSHKQNLENGAILIQPRDSKPEFIRTPSSSTGTFCGPDVEKEFKTKIAQLEAELDGKNSTIKNLEETIKKLTSKLQEYKPT